ncbi:MAG: mannose-1-phosphate guanylyltransferase [Bryobacteraceae bacterium]
MTKPALYGLILAGGRGTRFWPRSRRDHAKQVLSVVGESSLIQTTVKRLSPLIPPERLWVLTSDTLRGEIVRQLPEIPAGQILAEPAPRNTAPAIGLAARIFESLSPGALMGVFPSDHVIAKPAAYLKLVRLAVRAAAQGTIVVLGIQPTRPDTGFGYVEFEAVAATEKPSVQRVLQFREKPDLATARRYLRVGRFYWNAGMFFWRAADLLEALRRFLPRTATILSALPHPDDRQFAEKLKEAFPLCENISIDYAVLERASNVVGVPCGDLGWSDVGSWEAVHELLPKDEAGNVARSETLFEQSSNNYVDANGKLTALLGVEDLIVVDTPDALLVAHRSRAQQVGDLVKTLERKNRTDLL